MIAIVVLTHNRESLLRQCVSSVLARTSELTTEIVIWNNASTDGTAAYLETLTDPRIRVVHGPEAAGVNAYRRAFKLTTAPYLVELDDDVIDAPGHWDRRLLAAYERLPEIGFLAADYVDDPRDENAFLRHHGRPHAYRSRLLDGIEFLEGPTPGSCAITSRELYDRVGGFRERIGETYWPEDGTYIADIGKLGYRAAILADLQVHHSGGPPREDKRAFATRHWRSVARKNRVKRLLLAVPGVAGLNERRGWFEPPEEWWDDYFKHFDLLEPPDRIRSLAGLRSRRSRSPRLPFVPVAAAEYADVLLDSLIVFG